MKEFYVYLYILKSFPDFIPVIIGYLVFGFLIIRFFEVIGLYPSIPSKEKIEEAKRKSELLLDIQKDNENKILYLRNFNRDGFKYAGGWSQDRYITYETINFETKLSLLIGEIGQFIKVGLPHSQGNESAHRIELEEQAWKNEIIELMSCSTMIIYRPSLSVGLVWELEQIISQNYLPKTIICFSKTEDNKTDYNLFKEMVSSLINLPKIYFSDCYIYFNGKNKSFKTHSLRNVPLYKKLLLSNELLLYRHAKRADFINFVKRIDLNNINSADAKINSTNYFLILICFFIFFIAFIIYLKMMH